MGNDDAMATELFPIITTRASVLPWASTGTCSAGG
jgi:hypothetical protein